MMSPIVQTFGNGSARGYGAFLAAANSGSYESIATVTVGSGGTSNVEFTSIPGTYAHLQLRYIAQSSSGGSADIMNVQMQFNSDTAANYKRHYLLGTGAAVSAGADTGRSNIVIGTAPTNDYTNCFNAGVVDILDYANTNKNKTVRTLDGNDQNSGDTLSRMWFESALWVSTSAITSIKITMESSRTIRQYSSFALYGIKGA
jgi:hypothetical protein